ncbi:hypothetical protein [Gluconobacter cerinus]|nr:hypothetical protein [Gluconobacter cerinus]
MRMRKRRNMRMTNRLTPASAAQSGATGHLLEPVSARLALTAGF